MVSTKLPASRRWKPWISFFNNKTSPCSFLHNWHLFVIIHTQLHLHHTLSYAGNFTFAGKPNLTSWLHLLFGIRLITRVPFPLTRTSAARFYSTILTLLSFSTSTSTSTSASSTEWRLPILSHPPWQVLLYWHLQLLLSLIQSSSGYASLISHCGWIEDWFDTGVQILLRKQWNTIVSTFHKLWEHLAWQCDSFMKGVAYQRS